MGRGGLPLNKCADPWLVATVRNRTTLCDNRPVDYSVLQTRQFLLDHALEANPRKAFAFDGGPSPGAASFAWHAHPHHQLLYAPQGAVTVESSLRRYLLPPLRACVIAAGTLHRTVVGPEGKPAHSISVFFAPDFALTLGGGGVHTMNSSPLLCELIGLVCQWGPEHRGSPLSESSFRTLALLCQDWISQPVPFWLPRTDHPGIQKALQFVDEHLDSANETMAAEAAAMSERNFRRQFAASVGIAWREYLQRARMMRAADLLGLSDRSVDDIAWETGYRSVSAFTHAFREFSGEAPAAYRRH